METQSNPREASPVVPPQAHAALPWAGSVGGLLRERARDYPTTRFFRCSGDWRTFEDIDRSTDRVALGLYEKGVRKGDRVIVISANRDELIEVFLACAKLGAIQVPLNIFLKGDFLSHQITDADAKIAIVDAAAWQGLSRLIHQTAITRVIALDEFDEIEMSGVVITPYAAIAASIGSVPEVDVSAGDLMSILYTSGTTGMPKGCMLPHGYYRYAPYQYLKDGKILPGDRLMTAFPFFHTSAQVYMLMVALVAPAELRLTQAFSASTFMAQARAECATAIIGVGAMAATLLAQPPRPDDAAPGSLRMASFTPMSEEMQLRFESRFGVPTWGEGFGQTECMPICHMVTENRKRSANGLAADCLEVTVVDDEDHVVPPGVVGEIVVRPRHPNIMYQGYWRKPEATLSAMRNYWHHTGDFARMDAEGFVYFVDRKQQALRRRGENVSSIELETAIRKHADVVDVAVHAVPSALTEDDIKAVIVPREGHALEPRSLFAFFLESLPYFAVPRYVELRTSLPTNALGRVMKNVLKAEGVTAGTWDLETMGLVVPKSQRR